MSTSPTTLPTAGWSAQQIQHRDQQQKATVAEVPRTGERKRRGRGIDVMTFPTPPHSRQNTQLPTPETIRQPRKSTHGAKNDTSSIQPTVSFLPTPQTLPRHRAPLDTQHVRALSPSGQTTFIHSHSAQLQLTDIPVLPAIAAVPRRRPGLTFAQQMGLLTTTSTAAGGVFGGRLGVGVGMGGGHKGSAAHRGVDLISKRSGMDKEEENPFYVSPNLRQSSVKTATTSPRMALKSSIKAMLDEEGTDGEQEEDEAGPSSPLAGKSPLFPSTMPDIRLSTKRPRFTPPGPSRAAQPVPSTPSRHTLAPAPHFPSSPTRQSTQSSKLTSMLDAEHNPFLSRPSDLHIPTPAPGGMDESDRPYVTYVFRGAKKVFANPFTKPDMPFPPAQLRPEDEGYEEHPCPKPRLLWPSKPMRSARDEMEDDEEEEVTPSPPSSPRLRTPQTNRNRSRFLNADRSLESGVFNPPAEVYSDSDEERERVGAGSRPKESAGRRVESEDDEYSEEEEEVQPAIRRGLLFGPRATIAAAPQSGVGLGVKRIGEEVGGRESKKAKTLRM